jgi:hypothetical protein
MEGRLVRDPPEIDRERDAHPAGPVAPRGVAGWLRLAPGDAAQAVYVVAAAVAIDAIVSWVDAGWGLLAFATRGAEIVLAIGGGAAILRLATLNRVSRAASVVACTTAVVAWIAADRIHVVLFADHLDGSRLALLYEALRSGALRPDSGLLAGYLAAVALIAVLLRVVVAGLAFAIRAPRLASARARYGTSVMAALGLWVLIDPGATRASGGSASLPWGHASRPAEKPRDAANEVSPFGEAAEARMFAALERTTDALRRGSPISAERRPDIVIVHAESVRFDMFRPEVMPNVVRLAKTCIAPSHHYSTSNNTGSGMFGILNGLPVSYYHLARERRAKPAPLLVLKRVGYSLSVYYSSYLATYDGLSDLFFKDVVDRIVEEPDARAEVADERLVTRYVAEIAARDPAAPTFDYLVLESSHYDYAYPPAFEKFTPTATLGLGIRDGLVVRPGINEELKPKAPLVRNRYQDSILWVDSLVGRIADAWAARDRDVVLVVTGDHGEGFWETCGFGHGTSLCDEQTRVPMVMCIPGASRTRYTYTSHADILPTVFDFMGVTGVPGPLMAGKSLLRFDAARDVALVGYGLTGSESDDRLGVAGDGMKVVFSNRTPVRTIAVFDDAQTEVRTPLPQGIHDRAADLELRATDARLLR